jgi:hypothetical protein
MIKLIAILQIINLIFANVGLNVYLHYCNSTNTIITSLSKAKATCTDHICCNDHEKHHTLSNCKELSCCGENKSNIDLAIKDLECCQNAEKYMVLKENTININKTENNFSKSHIKIDFDIPFFINLIPKIPNLILSDEFYKFYKKKVISPTIYFSSNLV